MILNENLADDTGDSTVDQMSDPGNDSSVTDNSTSSVADDSTSSGGTEHINSDVDESPAARSSSSDIIDGGRSATETVGLSYTPVPYLAGTSSELFADTDSKWSTVSSTATVATTVGAWRDDALATVAPPPPPAETIVGPGEFVMRTLFAEFTIQAARKIEAFVAEPPEKPLTKALQRGEDAQFDQLLNALGSVAEHCLPSLLRALFAWYEREIRIGETASLSEASSVQPQPPAQQPASRPGGIMQHIVSSGSAPASASGNSAEKDEAEAKRGRRDLAVEFLFCLALIEVLRRLPFHPGHEDLVRYVEDVAFRHFRHREPAGANAHDVHVVADVYAEVVGVLARSRFAAVRRRFSAELKELRDATPSQPQAIVCLLIGMRFFRVKMAPIEEFEASFEFMREAAAYFLEVKDKDVKHALAGLFVEILVPVAAAVKNEVNVPCVKNFVDALYAPTLDACTKSKHRLALFPLVTCLLCVSQKAFFLRNWHRFLAMCLSHLKNRDPKTSRVALESLYRLLWAYAIRVRCESNRATTSRLQSVVGSLFPKGSKGVVPRGAPLNIFVKIVQFVARERLDFAMREIVLELLGAGRPAKPTLTPERVGVALRAFLVVADGLQQREGEPPMPRAAGAPPSGGTLPRARRTFLSRTLTEEAARELGLGAYFPAVKRALVDVLRALDAHVAAAPGGVGSAPPPDDAERARARVDLFRTCVAAVPRVLPDMPPAELVALLSRLTAHADDELRALACQSLQALVADTPAWRPDVVAGFARFVARDIPDARPSLVDGALRVLLQLLNAWKGAAARDTGEPSTVDVPKPRGVPGPTAVDALRSVEALALVALCGCRPAARRLAAHILRDAKRLLETTSCAGDDVPVVDAIDACCPDVLESVLASLPQGERTAAIACLPTVDLQWIAERTSCAWTAGFHDETSTAGSSGTIKGTVVQHQTLQRTSSIANATDSLALSNTDAWSACLFKFLERERVPTKCPTAVALSWPIVYGRLNALFSVIDPAPVSDNRASLLRGSAPARKPLDERDVYLHVWKNYLTFAFRVVPPIPSPIVRCASPDLSLSSSPDSLSAERGDSRSPGGGSVSPSALYKLALPLLRCETADVRDAVVEAVGKINAEAAKDLLDELVPYVRDAVDRKQENVRRRRRRDALRLQLARALERVAGHGALGSKERTNAPNAGLHPALVEYVEGVRAFLDTDHHDKDSTAAGGARELTLHFCRFVREMIDNFPCEARASLLKKDLKRGLFTLFAQSTGPYARLVPSSAEERASVTTVGPFLSSVGSAGVPQSSLTISSAGASSSIGTEQDSLGIASSALMIDLEPCSELAFAALRAMSALLCCGPCFGPQALAEDGWAYPWLDALVSSRNEKIYALGRETVVLLLEHNSDVGSLLDWVVDRCYTATTRASDGCFMALAAIFSAKEYPCDRYTAIVNVTLVCAGCPRPDIRDTALQLLQVLDERFFGARQHRPGRDAADTNQNFRTPSRSGIVADAPLATTFCRSQAALCRRLAQLHPELTMPMFSEITHRFQTARPEVRRVLSRCLVPWLHNMELVDPNVPPTNSLSYFQYYANDSGRISSSRREGWGSAEATEMVLNNLFYITAKFADEHPKEMEELWATLCACWPNNLKVIIRYLIIVSGMAPRELLPYAKRVVVYLARNRPDRLLDELMTELQTVETLNCLIERTETPPFYRLTSARKASSHSGDGGVGVGTSSSGIGGSTGCAGTGGGSRDAATSDADEKGLIHTKRHSGEDPVKATGTSKSDTALGALAGFAPTKTEKMRTASGPPALTDDVPTPSAEDEQRPVDGDPASGQPSVPQPHPLPMPEYGGYFAPLTEYLPDGSQPISGFHRCNVAVTLLVDVVADGDAPSIDWAIHVPSMLHVAVLGLDHARPPVAAHCRALLLRLLVVLGAHDDPLSVARVLLRADARRLDLYVGGPDFDEGVPDKVFTEPESERCADVPVEAPREETATSSDDDDETVDDEEKTVENVPETVQQQQQKRPSVSDSVKSLIRFLATRRDDQPLWAYEDITARVWTVRSAEQLGAFVRHTLKTFEASLPEALVAERWAQTALQLGLSCSSRHYAGRSLQVYRALRVPLTSRALTDVLSRLVETVAEPGEDMQGYVTELLLTLEAAVDSLEGDPRQQDVSESVQSSSGPLEIRDARRHARSTSYSPAAYGAATAARLERHARAAASDAALSRSRSAQSLAALAARGPPDGRSPSRDDRAVVLSQLFWLAASLLESDYEHEFLLALRLLERVTRRFPLDTPDARDAVERLQAQLRRPGFPGVHTALLKGCAHAAAYEPTARMLARLTPLLGLKVVASDDAFAMNVVALLPYMLLHYEDANELCVGAAEAIARASAERRLDNLGTVMTLYSRRTFGKESFQWTKCVVKYLHDAYASQSGSVLALLVGILERGPAVLQPSVLTIIHCVLHYVDLASPPARPVAADTLSAVARHLDGVHWKDALKILKLVVSRSSSLVAPRRDNAAASNSTAYGLDCDVPSGGRKELPGRTMEFTFDVTQTPVISGRRRTDEDGGGALVPPVGVSAAASPRRSASLSPADATVVSGWKRPWMSQGRVRECLVNLLTACGQRVGLPKSPSVIFSQSSDLLERQSSMASSTEEVSGTNNDLSGGDAPTEQFGVFKDFDFLEYESESVEGESTDNFNWGVRRRPLSEGDRDAPTLRQLEESISEKTPILSKRKRGIADESSDDEIGSESPLDEVVGAPEFGNVGPTGDVGTYPPSSLSLRDGRVRRDSCTRSDTSGSSAGDLGDVTPCNASPNLSALVGFRPIARDDAEEAWRYRIQFSSTRTPMTTLEFFHRLYRVVKDVENKTITTTRESCRYLTAAGSLPIASTAAAVEILVPRLSAVADVLELNVTPPVVWFSADRTVQKSGGTRLVDNLRYGALEIQEHLETYFDRRDHAIECLNGVRAALRIQAVARSDRASENANPASTAAVDAGRDELLLDLARAVYKLHFQLVLLIETAHKMASALSVVASSDSLQDLSSEAYALATALRRASASLHEDSSTSAESEERGTPTPTASPTPPASNPDGVVTATTINNLDPTASFCEMVAAERWSAALSSIRRNRSAWTATTRDSVFCEDDDDVSIALNVYGRHLVKTHPGTFVVCIGNAELEDVFDRILQVSSAVAQVELSLKDRDRNEMTDVAINRD